MKNRDTQKEATLALFVESAVDRALFLLDADGLIMTWNRGAEILTGWRESEIGNRSGEILYPPADIAAGKPAADLALAAAGPPTHQSAWRVRRDGSEYLADVTIAALRDEDGGLRGYGQIILDITELPAEIAVGESVTVISGNPEKPNSLDRMADTLNTIGYEIATHLGARLRRVIVD